MKPQSSAPDAAWQINVLADSARKLADQGNLVEAERVYRILIQNAPYHVRALNFLAVRTMERGELDESLRFLEQALRADPDRPILYQNLGLVYKARGELDLALAALDRAVALRPDFHTALFHKGALLEALGRTDEAVALYWREWRRFPNTQSLSADITVPTAFREVLVRAAETMRTTQQRLIADVMEPLQKDQGVEAWSRVMAAAGIHLGLIKPQYAHPLQQPSFLYLPDTEPRAFFEREEFPWISDLEAATPEIRAELQQILSTEGVLNPYVQTDQGIDPGIWRELNGSLNWSAYHLYKGGNLLDEHAVRCPVTVDSARKLPLPWIPGHAPELVFSILKPGAHIPPHHGLGNYKLVVHLPLIIPANCRIRVGEETRYWKQGKCLIFDDSFQHEAWNGSDSLRAVLILEIWNPLVTEVERQGLTALIGALNAFRNRYGAPAS